MNFISLIKKSMKLLNPQTRKKLIIISGLQAGLSILDLLAVATVGLVTALGVSSAQFEAPGSRVGMALDLLGIRSESPQFQAAVLSFLALALMMTRTILSVIFTKRTLFFLARNGALISRKINEELLKINYSNVRKLSFPEISFSLNEGVDAITIGVIGAALTLFSDFILLLVLGLGLFYISPILTLCASLFLGTVFFTLNHVLNQRAHKLGSQNSLYSVEANKIASDSFAVFREARLRDTGSTYVRRMFELRIEKANVSAEMAFLPNISKYVLETAVILGAALLAGFQFWFLDARHAASSLAIFLAAGTRLAPAILRIQQSLTSIKWSAGTAATTITLFEETIKRNSTWKLGLTSLDVTNKELHQTGPILKIRDLCVSYEKASLPAVVKFSIDIYEGDYIAIVGPSGAGKTSLVNAIMNFVETDSGIIEVLGVDSRLVQERFPGVIGYVPQDPAILRGSIRENILLGLSPGEYSDGAVWETLRLSGLAEEVLKFENQLDHVLDENGSSLSGGQKQRLAIARSLITTPRILVLDEPTSALDAETEKLVALNLDDLGFPLTRIVVAHRLSTVISANKVLYMESGHLVSSGTFSEVRAAVSNFDKQAKLMGL